MGGWWGAYTIDTTRKNIGMRLRPHVGGGVCQAARYRNRSSKVVEGKYCLLTGAFYEFSILPCCGACDMVPMPVLRLYQGWYMRDFCGCSNLC